MKLFIVLFIFSFSAFSKQSFEIKDKYSIYFNEKPSFIIKSKTELFFESKESFQFKNDLEFIRFFSRGFDKGFFKTIYFQRYFRSLPHYQKEDLWNKIEIVLRNFLEKEGIPKKKKCKKIKSPYLKYWSSSRPNEFDKLLRCMSKK